MIKNKNIFNRAKKIAVVRTDKIGDMVLTLPMGVALKEKFPDKEIIFIASRYTAPLLENNPALDRVFFIEDFQNGIKEIFSNEKPDIVFFPRPRFDELKAAFFAGIKHRVSSAFRWYSFFANHKIATHRKVSDKHEAEYNVNMIEQLIGESLPVKLSSPVLDKSIYEEVKQQMADSGVRFPFAIIHPGSGGSAKDVPLPTLGEAAKIISQQYELHIVLTGSKQEMEACNVIKKICPECVDLSGKFNLLQLMALTHLADTLVANSTGVLHIAAGFGANVVGLYPNTPHISAKRWGPYTSKKIILTPPTDDEKTKDDMKLIFAEAIAEAVGKFHNEKKA